MFKKVLLASAIAALSSTSFAMQAMDDESLSSTTGQDGLDIGITTANPITGDIILHDTDGVASLTLPNAGAIVIHGFSLDTFGNTITASVDATGDANNDATTNDPMLNIAVSIPTGTQIQTGSISVAHSLGSGAGYDNDSGTILNSMTLTLGATNMNIQLGNEVQGSMIALNTVMTGGLSIAGFALNDANSGGSINAGNITVSDAGAANTDLTLDVGVDATATGLSISLNTVGTGGMDVVMTNVGLGSATPIGDVDVVGLNVAGTTITLSGH